MLGALATGGGVVVAGKGVVAIVEAKPDVTKWVVVIVRCGGFVPELLEVVLGGVKVIVARVVGVVGG